MTNAQFLVGEAALFAPYVSTSKTYRCPEDGSVEEICGMEYWRVRSVNLWGWACGRDGLDGGVFCG